MGLFLKPSIDFIGPPVKDYTTLPHLRWKEASPAGFFVKRQAWLSFEEGVEEERPQGQVFPSGFRYIEEGSLGEYFRSHIAPQQSDEWNWIEDIEFLIPDIQVNRHYMEDILLAFLSGTIPRLTTPYGFALEHGELRQSKKRVCDIDFTINADNMVAKGRVVHLGDPLVLGRSIGREELEWMGRRIIGDVLLYGFKIDHSPWVDLYSPKHHINLSVDDDIEIHISRPWDEVR